MQGTLVDLINEQIETELGMNFSSSLSEIEMLVMCDDEKVENKDFAFNLCISSIKWVNQECFQVQLIINSHLTDN